MKQVKKLSVATVFGKIKLSELMAKPDKTMDIMQVIGVAVSTKAGDSDYGNWTALLGQFRATNLASGEVFEGSTLFLPDVAMTPIQVALGSSRAVEFAIVLTCTYVAEDAGHKAGGSPYEYSWKPLLEAGEDDPIARISAKVEARKLALANNPSVRENGSLPAGAVDAMLAGAAEKKGKK